MFDQVGGPVLLDSVIAPLSPYQWLDLLELHGGRQACVHVDIIRSCFCKSFYMNCFL